VKTRTIKLTVEYDGTDFNGWQIQPGGCRTVQAEIERALEIILKKSTRVHGSGRTDSGVHALGQTAHFKTSSVIVCDVLCRALNANLPNDIVIRDVCEAAADFHAQFSAVRKRYRYTIFNRQTPCAINRRFCTHIPYRLNAAAMRKAAGFFIGCHDFKSLAASDPARQRKGIEQNTVRTVFVSELKKTRDYLVYEVVADGFLYKMVRNIAGTLIGVGCGQIRADDIPDILSGKDRGKAGDTAPPQGLCLVEVEYGDNQSLLKGRSVSGYGCAVKTGRTQKNNLTSIN